jgi:hypothetical protein
VGVAAWHVLALVLRDELAQLRMLTQKPGAHRVALLRGHSLNLGEGARCFDLDPLLRLAVCPFEQPGAGPAEPDTACFLDRQRARMKPGAYRRVKPRLRAGCFSLPIREAACRREALRSARVA